MLSTIMTYMLQLQNLYLFFRWILRYDFRIKKSVIVLSICIILLGFLARTLFYDSMDPMFGTVCLRGSIVMLPVICFQVSLIKGLLLSINFRLVSSFLFSTYSALGMYFDVPSFAQGNAVIVQCLIFVIQCILVLLLKGNVPVEQWEISNILLCALALGLILLDYDIGMVVSSTDKQFLKLVGKSQMLTGIVALMLVVISMLQVLMYQKHQLKALNLLNEKCIREQTMQYRRLEQKDQELKYFQHDFKAHLSAIEAYVNQNDFEKLMRYIREIGEFKEIFHTYATGNVICDAILSQYIESGKKDAVEILFLGKIPELSTMKETDLCVIFSNAMSNAYEATKQCNGNRKLKVSAATNGDRMFLKIENPSVHELRFTSNGLATTKEVQKLHGIGSRNMKQVAEKYDGSVSWNYEDGIVTTTINLRF